MDVERGYLVHGSVWFGLLAGGVEIVVTPSRVIPHHLLVSGVPLPPDYYLSPEGIEAEELYFMLRDLNFVEIEGFFSTICSVRDTDP